MKMKMRGIAIRSTATTIAAVTAILTITVKVAVTTNSTNNSNNNHKSSDNCQRNSSSSSYSKPTVAGTCLSVRVDVLKLRQAACGAYHK